MDNDEEKEIEKEIREFHDLSPHRARAISLGALLENRLTAYLKTVMLSDAKTVNELFQPSGALGNFGTKIRIAYLFGLISNFVFRDLLIINKIRNEFAHKPEVKKFDSPPINAWIAQLNLNKAIVNLQ